MGKDKIDSVFRVLSAIVEGHVVGLLPIKFLATFKFVLILSLYRILGNFNDIGNVHFI